MITGRGVAAGCPPRSPWQPRGGGGDPRGLCVCMGGSHRGGGGAGGGGPGPVTCGSVVKLLNVQHNVRLHSHDVRYGSGSGQQSVTGVAAADDGNSYWRVRGRTAAVCERGRPVRCGQAIRLTHLGTGRNLHSHRFASPLSGNQEVSAFGEDGEVTGEQYGRPIHGQKEVHGAAASSQHNYWKVMEGVFMQPRRGFQSRALPRRAVTDTD
uniref:Stromal cell derived factor 2 n=1 Tax=Anas platyrhynchos TaxID=8839 RepID=A0A8B9QZG7_ANAPL